MPVPSPTAPGHETPPLETPTAQPRHAETSHAGAASPGAASGQAVKVAPRGPQDGIQRRRVVVLLLALLIPLVMAAALSGSYLAALHHPSPHSMKVEVVGTSPQAQQLVPALSVRSNHTLEVTQAASLAGAEQDVRSLEARAAYDPTTGALYTATAGSPLATQAVTQAFTQVAQQTHQPLVVHDLVPRPAHDTSGLSLLFMALGATLCGYMSASVVSMAAPRLSSGKHLAVIGGMSIAGAVTIAFVTYGIYGAYTSHLAPVMGLLALGQFSAALFQYAGYRLIGAPMTLISILVMVVLGSPASGVFVPADMMPSFFSWIHPLLPTSTLADGLRRVLDFHATGVARSITVLLAWTMASAWMLHVANLRHPAATNPTPQPTHNQPATTPVSTPVSTEPVSTAPVAVTSQGIHA